MATKYEVGATKLDPIELASGLRADFDGQVIAPGDSDYDSARSVWNGAIDRRPALIARCMSAKQVASAIAFARGQGLPISVRGGGHSFAGFAVSDGALMIDLSAMRQIEIDTQTGRASAGGGATWADLDAAAQAHGLAVPGGFISHTGIGGLTLGGGIGWLSRKAGLSADNLISAQLVTADSQILEVSATESSDLFWAIRGGGGNFGVVTRFDYQVHKVGPLVQLGLFFWTADRGIEALRFCREIVKTLPDDMGIFLAGLSAPPAPFVPEQYHFAKGYALIVAGFNSADEVQRVAGQVHADLPPTFELVTPIPYTSLQKMFDDGAAWGSQAYEKALYLDELSDAAIEVFVEHLPKASSPLSFVPIFGLGGQYSRADEGATAFGGSRSARYVFNIAAICPTPELLVADRAWVRDLWEAMRPHATGAGSYVNFMAEYDEDRVRASYGQAKYDRLTRVKAQYDPENVFQLNANIKPALQPV